MVLWVDYSASGIGALGAIIGWCGQTVVLKLGAAVPKGTAANSQGVTLVASSYQLILVPLSWNTQNLTWFKTETDKAGQWCCLDRMPWLAGCHDCNKFGDHCLTYIIPSDSDPALYQKHSKFCKDSNYKISLRHSNVVHVYEREYISLWDIYSLCEREYISAYLNFFLSQTMIKPQIGLFQELIFRLMVLAISEYSIFYSLL